MGSEHVRPASQRRSLSPAARRSSAIGAARPSSVGHSPAYAHRTSTASQGPRQHEAAPSPTGAGSIAFVSPSAYTPRSQNADRYAHTERSPTPTHVVPQFPYSSQLVHPLPAAPDLLPSTGFSPHSEDEALVTLDLAILPDGQTIDDLLTHLASCSNAAFPILHVPTLRTHLARVLAHESLTMQRACVLLCTFCNGMMSAPQLMLTVTLAVSVQSLPKRSPLAARTRPYSSGEPSCRSLFGDSFQSLNSQSSSPRPRRQVANCPPLTGTALTSAPRTCI
jgi:hypothetical protein